MSEDTFGALKGQRLLTLQHVVGLTQTELADRLGVTQGLLSRVIRGSRPLSESLALSAATEFAVPLTFFSVPTEPADTGPVTFRKNSKVRAKDEARVVAYYTEAARLFRSVSEASGYTEAAFPSGEELNDPETLAMSIRRSLGLSDDKPVMNATRALERLGVGVVDQLDDSGFDTGHTGISRPSTATRRPLVALTADVPGAVKRLTLLHEYFHILADRNLDAPITSTRSTEERKAFHFAGAFMLPERVARKRISESLNLHGYLPIKADYGLSVAAILKRGHTLGLITSDRYRSLSIQLSSAGWRASEPVEVPDEKPALLKQAITRVYGQSPVARASHNLGMSPDWIVRWADMNSITSSKPVHNNVVDLQARRSRS
ncbi:ImmA/IrrE family metallo-endopeptidase [Mycobacteroides abscessus]